MTKVSPAGSPTQGAEIENRFWLPGPDTGSAAIHPSGKRESISALDTGNTAPARRDGAGKEDFTSSVTLDDGFARRGVRREPPECTRRDAAHEGERSSTVAMNRLRKRWPVTTRACRRHRSNRAKPTGIVLGDSPSAEARDLQFAEFVEHAQPGPGPADEQTLSLHKRTRAV